MSREPRERVAPALKRLPFGISAGEAQLWMKRGTVLGTLLSLLFRRRMPVRLPRPARPDESTVGRARRT